MDREAYAENTSPAEPEMPAGVKGSIGVADGTGMLPKGAKGSLVGRAERDGAAEELVPFSASRSCGFKRLWKPGSTNDLFFVPLTSRHFLIYTRKV